MVLTATTQPAVAELPQSYHREARSYSTNRESDPPPYVRIGLDPGTWQSGAGGWLDIGLQARFRYEVRDDDLRLASPEWDDALLVKSSIYLGVRERLDPLRFAVELQDSRREFSRNFRSDREINEFEPIRLYAELYFRDLLGKDDLGNFRPLSIRAGRMPFEFLDRRLVSSNPWRNTTNTFQGLRATVGQEANDWQVDLLAVRPLSRRKYEWDQPAEGQWFYGAIGHWRRWSDLVTLEPYYLCLTRNAGAGVQSREIHSIALRAFGMIGASGLDFDINIVRQFGREGAEPHRAFGAVAEMGYTFSEHPWRPRASLFYGFASGDEDATDNRDGRFERYFGFGRAWSSSDYIVWENLSSPKVRLEFQPHRTLRIDAAYSWYWMASAVDRWAATGLRDTTGRSGKYLGQEADIRLRWSPIRNLEANVGYAHFFAGDFPRQLGRGHDSDFYYVELTLTAF